MTMEGPFQTLARGIQVAISQVAGRPVGLDELHLRAAGDPKFGDYQCNAAMALAKSLGKKPRELAEAIAAAVQLSDIVEPLEVAGPGFLNLRLRRDFLERFLESVPSGRGAGGPTSARFSPDDRLGIPPTAAPHTIVIDYSSPNIAKQMHVGHLRSSIIGDVFARTLEFVGHRVVRQNHTGDWGTAMGAVITGLWYIRTRMARRESLDAIRARLRAANSLKGKPIEERRAWLAPIAAEWTADLAQDESATAQRETSLDELELGYVFVQTLAAVAAGTDVRVGSADNAARLEDIPRLTTTFLQRGDAWEKTEWEQARDISMRTCQQLYDRLGITLRPEDVFGESAYDAMLKQTVADIRTTLAQRRGPAGGVQAEFREDAGAACIFLFAPDSSPAYKTAEGEPLPMIIQKSDGAYLYASTDLAAIRYRVATLGSRRVIYVVGAPQKLHFEMLFAAARALGWAGPEVALEHVMFGSVLGENRRPLKTREGGNIKLRDLIDEAERRAFELLEARDAAAASDPADRPGESRLTDSEKREIAQRVGVAAIKYFDLARDRNGDYVFNWDQMLAFQGNTAPYMMYAYARIRSIYRKAAAGAPATASDPHSSSVHIRLEHGAERALGLRLARFQETVHALAADLLPHVLCGYLYELAADFMRFYENCPVLGAADEGTRLSRLRLSDLTARTLKLGLSLLGIDVIERM